MTHRINCPACQQKLYFPSFSDFYEHSLESICRKCKHKYTLEQAEVIVFSSELQVLHRRTWSKAIAVVHKRIYQMRLVNANQTRKSVEFSTLGQQENLTALPGDKMLLLYTIDKKQQNLTWIENQTTTQSYRLQQPGAKTRSIGTAAGFMAFAGGIVLATVLNLPLNKLFLATVTPIAVGIGVTVAKRKSIKVKDLSELLRLGSEQQLLVQKFDLEQKLTGLNQELGDNLRLINRLKSLQEQMIGVDRNLYDSKITTVSNGVAVLEKNLSLTSSLITGYEHIYNMLSIEYETFKLAEQIPGDIITNILGQLEELKAIEAQKEKMSLLIAPHQLLDLNSNIS